MMVRYLSVLIFGIIFLSPVSANHLFLEQVREPKYIKLENIDIETWHSETLRWIKSSLVDEYPDSALKVEWLEIKSGEEISYNHTQYERLKVSCTFKNHLGPHGYDVQDVYVWLMEKNVITNYYPSTAMSPL